MADVVAKFKLEDGSELPIGKSFISSLKSVSESTADASSINYGTLANSGSIEIQDGNGYISKMIDDGILPVSDLDVNIEVDGEIFQQHITTDSDYDTEDNTLNISLSNFVKDFDILKYKGFQYPDSSRTLYEIFVDVLNSYFNTTVENIDSMFDDDVLEYIKNIKIEFPYVEYGKTYREVIDSLCTIAQLNMFITKENKPKFISARPVYSSEDAVTQLTWGDVVADLQYTKTLKNKFDGVEISSSRPISEVFYDAVVYSEDALSTTNVSQAMNLSEFNSKSGNNRGFDSGTILDTKLKYATLYLSATKIKNYYVEGDLYINKSANDNLSNILKIKNSLWDSEGNPLFIIHYDKYEDSSVSATINTDTGVASSFNSSNLKFVSDGAGYIDQSISYSFKPNGYTNTATSTASETDSSYINVSLSGDTYKIHYKILCGQDVLYFGGEWSDSYILTPPTSADINCAGKFTRYKPKYIEFSLYGNKREISFKEVSSSTENIENKKVKATVKPSSLLQTKTTYIGEMIANVIKQNILTDYRKGISDGKLTLNKDLVDIGDFIKYPNDRRVWKVVGKELDYSGEYLFPISVMQCLKPYSSSGLFDEYDECVYTWDELIENGTVSVSGTELVKVNSSATGRLKIDNSIKSIKQQCFYGSKFDEVYISNSVETLGSHLFINSSVKKIVIGEGVKNIGKYAFNDMPNLEEIEYNAINCNDLPTENRVFWNTYSSGAVLKFGKSVRRVPNYLFCPYETDGIPSRTIKILDIKWENGTNPVEIGYKAFYGLNVMLNLQLPNNLTKIDDDAFYYGVEINNIFYSGSIEDWLKINFVGYGSRAFAYKPSWWVLNMGSSSGSETTFYDGKTYYKPTKLITPTNISTIKQYSFEGFRQINEVVITSNITKIGVGAFGETRISKATFEDPNGWYYNGELLNLKYPEKVGEMLRTKGAYEWIKS